MENLFVSDAWVTRDRESSSYGAITLSCVSESGENVNVRVMPLYDENKQLIGPEAYLNHTIDVRGIADVYDGEYQIKVFTASGIDIDNE